MKSLLPIFCLLASALGAQDLVVPGPGDRPPMALAPLLDGVDARRLRAEIAFLSDPRQEGRGLGTRGLERVARHLGREMARFGLRPLPGQPSFVQAVPLTRITELGGGLSLPGGRVLHHGVDCLLPQRLPLRLEGRLVDAGLGIREPALGRDDYKGLDIRGKIVLIRPGVPEGEAWRAPGMKEKWDPADAGSRYDSRLAVLESLGAAAVVALDPDFPTRVAQRRDPAFFRPEAGVEIAEEPPLVLAAPAAIPEGRASLEITGRVQRAASLNLVGCIPGSDPALKDQAVVIGAHMDHLGLQGGLLHPGADDNASGVSALLELIRAFAGSAARPRRTLVFAFWTGEEDGKFGSGHYVRHPLWPLAKTRVYLNLDMIGHAWDPGELRALLQEKAPELLPRIRPEFFNDPGYAEWDPALRDVLSQAGRATGMALLPDPGDGRNGGSDYRDFARRKVPYVRFFGSFFPGYHQPGDTLDHLDPEQVRRMARLALAAAWSLAWQGL
nr:M20/M25/M40 family metallo-hydrolase [uncultured Holophaga sp.]